MDLIIRGRHMDVPEKLRAVTEEKVTRLTRHMNGWDHAEVQFVEERNPRISEKEVCEVVLRGHGQIVRAKAAAPDPYTAVDRVVDKLTHQVEKLKTRQSRKGHHRARPGAVELEDLDQEEEEEEGLSGRIVRVELFDHKPMTPEEAALQMQLRGQLFHFFIDAESGAPAVVYRRSDGDIGLIEVT